MISLSFDEEMIVPEHSFIDYSEYIEITLTSGLDGSIFEGIYEQPMTVDGGWKKRGLYTQEIPKEELDHISSHVYGCKGTELKVQSQCDILKKWFTWSVDAHTPDLLNLNLEFENPGAISMSSHGQDKIGLFIKDESFFRSKATGKVV